MHARLPIAWIRNAGTGCRAALVLLAATILACDQPAEVATDRDHAPSALGFRGAQAIECNPFTNDCPVGEKCMPWANDGGPSWNATRCSPVLAAAGEVGDPCTVEGSGVSGIDSCERGAMCWEVDPRTDAGHCVATCQGGAHNPLCLDPESECTISAGGVLTLCLPICDPIAQACNQGQGCYNVYDRFACAPDGSGTDGAAGDACEFINACDPGLLCLAADATPGCEGIGCCTPVCSLSAPSCPDGQSCVPWFAENEAPPSLGDVGVCTAAG